MSTLNYHYTIRKVILSFIWFIATKKCRYLRKIQLMKFAKFIFSKYISRYQRYEMRNRYWGQRLQRYGMHYCVIVTLFWVRCTIAFNRTYLGMLRLRHFAGFKSCTDTNIWQNVGMEWNHAQNIELKKDLRPSHAALTHRNKASRCKQGFFVIQILLACLCPHNDIEIKESAI